MSGPENTWALLPNEPRLPAIGHDTLCETANPPRHCPSGLRGSYCYCARRAMQRDPYIGGAPHDVPWGLFPSFQAGRPDTRGHDGCCQEEPHGDQRTA